MTAMAAAAAIKRRPGGCSIYSIILRLASIWAIRTSRFAEEGMAVAFASQTQNSRTACAARLF